MCGVRELFRASQRATQRILFRSCEHRLCKNAAEEGKDICSECKESELLPCRDWVSGVQGLGLFAGMVIDARPYTPACWKYRNYGASPSHRDTENGTEKNFTASLGGLRSHQPRTQSERLVRRMCRCPSAEELVAVTVSLGLAAETGTLWLPATSLRMSAPACTSSTSTTIESS